MKTRSGESISSFYSTRVTTSPNLPTDPPSLIITDSNLAPRTTHVHLQLTTRGTFKVIREEKSARAEGPFCGRITILSSCNGYVKGIGEKGVKGEERDRKYPQRKSSFLLCPFFLFLPAAEPEGVQLKGK